MGVDSQIILAATAGRIEEVGVKQSNHGLRSTGAKRFRTAGSTYIPRGTEFRGGAFTVPARPPQRVTQTDLA